MEIDGTIITDEHKLIAIAETLGTTIEQLLESGKTAEEIITEYEDGSFRLLNE